MQTNRRRWVGGELGFSWFPTFKKSDRFYTQPRERAGRLDERKFADAEHALLDHRLVSAQEDEEELWRAENRRLTGRPFWHGRVGKGHRVLKGVPERLRRRKPEGEGEWKEV